MEEFSMKKAGLYIRVSTTEQFEHGFSVDEQRERLMAYCKAMNWDVCGVYVDGGYSGKDTNRPALQKIIKEIKLLDIVVIYKLDRLSRSQKDTLMLIEDVLIKNNVDIVSLQENLDTSSPFGRAAIGILSAFAQLERETFKERSILGRTGRARKGKWVGNSRPPIGYDYDVENQQLIVNEYEAEQVKKVFELYLAGTGLQRIAYIMHEAGYKHKYGDWSWWGGVTTMLKNTVYIGKVKFNGEEFDGEHQPIIDRETFKQAQEALLARQTGQLYKRHSPFSHLLYCKKCGARMFFLKKRDKGKYYCYSRWGRTKQYIKDKNCKMRIWDSESIDKEILKRISRLVFDKKEINKIMHIKPKKNSTHALETRVKELDKQINKLLDLYQYGSFPIDVLNDKVRVLHDEKSSLVATIEKVKMENNSQKQTNQIIFETATEIANKWDKIELPRKVELLNILIEKVIVDHESIDILWTFAQKANE
jgi:site-specific DNA recombinase